METSQNWTCCSLTTFKMTWKSALIQCYHFHALMLRIMQGSVKQENKSRPKTLFIHQETIWKHAATHNCSLWAANRQKTCKTNKFQQVARLPGWSWQRQKCSQWNRASEWKTQLSAATGKAHSVTHLLSLSLPTACALGLRPRGLS